jgi:IS30 family transposase
MMQGLPLRSISMDNGSEFADFRRLEEQLQTPVYFAEPHKP